VSQVFARSSQLADKIYDVKLHIPEWKVLFATDGKKDAAAIADFLDLEQKEVEEAFTRLSELGFLTPLKAGGEEPAPPTLEEITGLEEEEVAEETPAEEAVEKEQPKAEETEAEIPVEEPVAETETAEKPTELDELIGELGESEEPAAKAAEQDTGKEEFTLEAEKEEIEESTEEGIEEEEIEAGLEKIKEIEERPEEKSKELPEEPKTPETDEDLDILINDLLKEESTETTGEEAVASSPETGLSEKSAPEEGLESFFEKSDETEGKETEGKFETPVEAKKGGDVDLGDIFQSELSETEQSLEDMLETMETEETVEEEVEAEKMEPPLSGGAPQKTVLVVDDSVVIRKMVEIALENENYNIVSVANGKDALAYLDEKEPDIVILDIMLPDVNGLDILKAIKASKDIPVVMLSAKDTPRETSKAKELGADDFIPKPFKDEELIGKIQELVGK